MKPEIGDKIDLRGAGALSDEELLTRLVGDAVVARALLEEAGSLADVARIPATRLRMVGGMGRTKAHQLLAAIELGRRIATSEDATVEVITSSEDVIRMMLPALESLAHEECWVIYLTNSNRVIERCRISQGGVTGTVVDYKLVVKRALELLSTRLILVHNHPSGAAKPSEEDRRLTRRLKEACALFDIRLLDHLILAREGNFSFKAEGLL